MLMADDHSPFGMIMPGRTFNAGSGYRYGFNGKENDNEVKGEGNQITFENRVYDPRISRWLSLDPMQKKYPGETNYSFVSSNPIIYADADGRDKIYVLTIIDKDGKSQTQRKIIDKDIFVNYQKVEVHGFGNNRYYRNDLIVSTTIDLRGDKGKVTYSRELGDLKEIGPAIYYWQKAVEWGAKEGPRGSQAGGITLTSEFPLQSDGPKTDVTKGSDGSINIDVVNAAFGALSKSGEALNFTIEDLPDWVSQAKDLVDAYQSSNDESKTNETKKEFPSNIKKGNVVNYGTNNYKKINDSTWKETKQQATDTSPVWKGYKAPEKKKN